MSPDPAIVHSYRFGPFRLLVADRILERDGERIQLTPKIIDTLFVLVANAGQVVTKDALMKAVWPDVTVVESGLTRNISVLRKALEEGEAEGTYIETIPRRGYRFVAPVRPESAAAPATPPSTPVIAPPEPVRASRKWLATAAVVAVSVSAIALWYSFHARIPLRPVEPFVRIGEHLLYKLAPDETVRASEHFERAIASNPDSPGAHAGLAVAYLQLTAFGVRPPAETLDRADRAARRALALDGRSAMAHYAMGMVNTFRRWDFSAAASEFRQALELQPDSVQARLGYARLKGVTRQPREALRLIEEALALDPASPALGAEYCRAFYTLRDYRRAESECRKVLDRESGYALAHYYLALALGWLGRLDEAGKSLDRSGLMPGVVEADRAWLALRAGNRRPALDVLNRRRELIRDGTVDATAKLLLAAILDLRDEAFEAIEAGLATRAPELVSIEEDPRLDPIRSDPRYADVLRRIGISR